MSAAVFKVMLPAAKSGLTAGVILGNRPCHWRGHGSEHGSRQPAHHSGQHCSAVCVPSQPILCWRWVMQPICTGRPCIATGVVLFVFILLINLPLLACSRRRDEQSEADTDRM